ncbi:unnamed protein product [Cochlearia groenlandica]
MDITSRNQTGQWMVFLFAHHVLTIPYVLRYMSNPQRKDPTPSNRKKTTAVRPPCQVAQNVQKDSTNEASSSTSIKNEDLTLLKVWVIDQNKLLRTNIVNDVKKLLVDLNKPMGNGKSSVGRKWKNPATPVTLSDSPSEDERGRPSETAPNAQQTTSDGSRGLRVSDYY